MLRKQIRQTPNLRKYARERPQNIQRLYLRVLYFGSFLDFTIKAFRATKHLANDYKQFLCSISLLYNFLTTDERESEISQ